MLLVLTHPIANICPVIEGVLRELAGYSGY